MSYNVENLFDCRHDTLKDDHEFLPEGERHWTFKRYWKKLNDIARVIHQCGEPVSGEAYHLPDVVILLEVENDSVLDMLTRRSLLRTVGYKYIITDSPDVRGIDVAVLYNPLTFRPDTSYSIRVSPPKGQRPTRDILCVRGHSRRHVPMEIFALHSPSRSGGPEITENYRVAVVDTLIDNLPDFTKGKNAIVAGDFNDYSRDKSVRKLSTVLHEVSKDVRGLTYKNSGIKGTYFYQGEWGSLDHIFVSPSLTETVKECYIFDREWLLERNASGNLVPFRTFRGHIYNKGVSDHLPLVLRLDL